MSNIDLHMHSCFSDDGEYTPEEIIDKAVKNNVEIISISDHNSVKAIERALNYTKDKEIKVIPGIEIDCTFNGINLHLLGYNIDYKEKDFYNIEEDILNQERSASKEKIRLIKEHTGLNIHEEEVLKRSTNGVVTGELIAEILLEDKENRNSTIMKPYLEGGSRSDMPYVNFYWDYFSQGKPAYVPIKFITLKEAIKLIHRHGGQAIIAHPGNNLKENLDIIDELIKEGIDGIEVFSSYHTKEQTDYFYIKALKNDMIITCGSDFHGKTKPNIEIGKFKFEPKDISIDKIFK
ncbi:MULTISPECIES: PHP domain-containing protein [unclassified Clostridium]|uniref:PHP domain-containing protein n=1 Tax=unclassified Clostridium TaxID=2614128 RepID=UPI00189A48B1|nr:MULTISPECIES: PHP domain-containing protein [unclassified Clostridium]MCR1952634.1 PHP domain-containing protein [Clostridium sp. DSM 100503]